MKEYVQTSLEGGSTGGGGGGGGGGASPLDAACGAGSWRPNDANSGGGLSGAVTAVGAAAAGAGPAAGAAGPGLDALSSAPGIGMSTTSPPSRVASPFSLLDCWKTFKLDVTACS